MEVSEPGHMQFSRPRTGGQAAVGAPLALDRLPPGEEPISTSVCFGEVDAGSA
jgi:hypothetical protein